MSYLYTPPSGSDPITAMWPWARHMTEIFAPIAVSHIRRRLGSRVTITDLVLPVLGLQPQLDGLQACPSLQFATCLATRLQCLGLLASPVAEVSTASYRRHQVVVSATPEGCYRLSLLCADPRPCRSIGVINAAPRALRVPPELRSAAAEAALQFALACGGEPEHASEYRECVRALGLEIGGAE